MVNHWEIEEKKKEHERELIKNPLLDTGLGKLILEKDRLIIEDPNIVKPREEVTVESLENYKKYNLIIKELDRREQEYTRRHYSEIKYRVPLT